MMEWEKIKARMPKWLMTGLLAVRGPAEWTWGFLTTHHEPITGFAAIFVAVISLILGIGAQHDANLASALSRLPVIQFSQSNDPGSFYLANAGLGPANVYQLDLAVGDEAWTITQESTRAETEEAVQFAMAMSLADVNLSAAEALAQGPYAQGKPITVVRADTDTQIFGYRPGFLAAYPASTLIDQLSLISARVCYTDLLGDMEAQALHGPDREWKPCPNAPGLYRP